MGDVIGEAKVLVKDHIQVADRRICNEYVGGCRIKVVGKEGRGLFELVTQTYKYEFSLKGVKAQEI